MRWEDFKEIWIADFEFFGSPNPPIPLCVVAREVQTGKTVKEWLFGKTPSDIPYSTRSDSLFVAYYASAEFGCHLSLDWPRPSFILDLFTEYRCLTNGLKVPANSLLGALTFFGISGGDTTYKDSMRDRILAGPPYTEEEKDDILHYCEKDVDLTVRLFERMKELIDYPRALLRGRYMWAVAEMERCGIPVNVENYLTVQKYWESVKDRLIEKIDSKYRVYENGVFKIDRFKEYLIKNGIEWDLTDTGKPKLTDSYLRDQAKAHPELRPFHELRYSIGQLKLNALEIGDDGRNRCLLSPFRAKTGRNAPSSSKFIFGPAVWVRYFISPSPDRALAYIDFEQQEFGIGAALSNDPAMIEAYASGDPYLAFAKQAKAIPQDATKESHPNERDMFKTCVIALQYGMSEETFAKRINSPITIARELYRLHKETYAIYWAWIEDFIDRAKLRGYTQTKYGWTLKTRNTKHRTLQNFPMQANGAEILRIACCLAVETGVQVCAPIHDAILIEAAEGEIAKTISKTQKLMGDASEWVLGGFRLRTDAQTIHYPDTFTDSRGAEMWGKIWEIIHELRG